MVFGITTVLHTMFDVANPKLVCGYQGLTSNSGPKLIVSFYLFGFHLLTALWFTIESLYQNSCFLFVLQECLVLRQI